VRESETGGRKKNLVAVWTNDAHGAVFGDSNVE
jgi:hypothetical protein